MFVSLGKLVGGNPSSPVPVPSAAEVIDELYPWQNRHFFLFKQGFRKTNLALAELISLLQIHCSAPGKPDGSHYQLIADDEAMEYLNESLRLGFNTDSDHITRLSLSVIEYFSTRIVLVSLYTGAYVYLPDGHSISLANITAESGYIHSCGDLVLAENTQTLNPVAAEIYLNRHVDALNENERFLLVPYCHEDFSARDRQESEFLKDGLDEVKLNITKHFIGEMPLHQFILEFVEARKRLGVAAPTDYKLSRLRFAEQFPNKSMATFWLISDTALSSGYDETSGSRTLICYRQRFKNDNPYHHYEENKPAWVSHTTLPHSLAGAMINIARPWLPNSNAVICDPFCGSGTIYLEAQKFPLISCNTSDQSPLAEAILRDNIAFFRLNDRDLGDIINQLESYETSKNSLQPKLHGKKKDTGRDVLERVIGVIDDWWPKCDGDFLTLTSDIVSQGLEKIGKSLGDRIVLYVALRASVRGSVFVAREAADWTDVFERELKALLRQMHNHLKSVKSGEGVVDRVATFEGSYSNVIVPPRPYDQKVDLFGSGDFSLRAVENLPKRSCDAIICDPPYGFNTETDRWSAEDFVSGMVPALIEALRDGGGQIILAAPRTSFSGRAIPLNLRSDYLSRAILQYCQLTNRQCWKPAVVYPGILAGMLSPPYYWTAEKTLTRMILHFWIRPRKR